jgi:hypothetical protein
MHRSRMLRMMGMMVRMKKIVAVLVDVRECPVLIRSVLMIMHMGMDVLIMAFIGIFWVIMVVTMRHLMTVPMIMIVVMVMRMILGVIMDMITLIVIRVIVMCLALIMSMGMLMSIMNMSGSGLFYCSFLFIGYKRIAMNVMHGLVIPQGLCFLAALILFSSISHTPP